MTAQPDEDPIAPKPGRRFLWGRERKVTAPPRKGRRSDILIALAGTGLGLGCALFPWYVFFNQEQFGVRALRFSREGEIPPPTVTYQPPREMPPIDSTELPAAELDLFATGTLPDAEKPAFLPPAAQPFPGDAKFQVVHIANGRAMVADGEGMWVVQTGSTLPDASRVAAIEQRDGEWVLVTSGDRVLRAAN